MYNCLSLLDAMLNRGFSIEKIRDPIRENDSGQETLERSVVGGLDPS
jgi:DNA-binding transcriptional MerR regulator